MTMYRSINPLALLLALPVATCAVTACNEQTLRDGGTYAMKIADQPFTLQISCSDPTRARGLGGVTRIPDDGGMLFIFPDAKVRQFYMKDCLVDMDIMFLDPLGYVTATYTMTAEPLQQAGESETAYINRLRRYQSLTPAQYAIELRKGRLAELGIKTRQKIPLDTAALRVIAK